MTTFSKLGRHPFWTSAIWLLVTPAALFPINTASFNAPKSFAVGKTPSSVAVGDFNGDGKLDLAITSLANNTVSILLGDGHGGFGRATAYPAGPTPKSVTAGDFNSDGKLDLAAANGSSGTISVLLGNGDGSFQTPIPYPAGTDIVFVSVGDFNGDGKTDLVGADSTANMVAVLLNNDGGTFQTPRTKAEKCAPMILRGRGFNELPN